LRQFARELCDRCWSQGCGVKAEYYSDYTHPSRMPVALPQSRLAPGVS